MTDETLNNDLTKLRFLDENGETYPDWEEKQLGELGSWGKNHSLSKTNINSDGENKILLYGELYMKYDGMFKVSKILSRTSYCSKNPLKFGSIVMPTSGETRHQISRAVAILDDKEKIFTSGDMLIFHPNNAFVASEFLSLSMNSNKVSKEVSKMGQGFSVVHVSKRTWEFTEHSIPSLPEQTKIAEFLSNLDERIEQQSKLVELLKEQKQSYSQRLFNGSLRFKKDDGTDYEDWEEKKFSDIFIDSSKRNDQNYPQYTVGKNGLKIKEEQSYEINNHKMFEPNSLLLGLGIEEATVSVSTYGSCSPVYSVFLFDNNKIAPYMLKEYIRFWLNKKKHFVSKTSTRREFEIVKSDLKKQCIIIPSLPEQEKIAEFLSSLDERIDEQLNKLEQLKLEKQSYMQKVLV